MNRARRDRHFDNRIQAVRQHIVKDAPSPRASPPRYCFCRTCRRKWRIAGIIFDHEPKVMCHCGSQNVEVKLGL